MNLRFALDSDVPALKAFLKNGDWPVDGIEFVGIGGFWLIVETDKIVGCVQLAYSRPFGMAENMLVDPELGAFAASKVLKKLTDATLGVLKYMGSNGIVNQIPFANKKYKKTLEKRGWVTISSGNLMARRM